MSFSFLTWDLLVGAVVPIRLGWKFWCKRDLWAASTLSVRLNVYFTHCYHSFILTSQSWGIMVMIIMINNLFKYPDARFAVLYQGQQEYSMNIQTQSSRSCGCVKTDSAMQGCRRPKQSVVLCVEFVFVCACVHLGMLSSTVAHPYRKTMTPTREAGISIWV